MTASNGLLLGRSLLEPIGKLPGWGLESTCKGRLLVLGPVVLKPNVGSLLPDEVLGSMLTRSLGDNVGVKAKVGAVDSFSMGA